MENKISQEHLEKLQKLHNDTQNVKMELANVTIEMSGLESRKTHLVTIHEALQQQDQDFSDEIRKTYGEVKSINFQTGEYSL